MSTRGGVRAAVVEPTARQVGTALGLALLFVLATRWPAARPAAFDLDEIGYLEAIREYDLPPGHTLFLAAGKVVGRLVGEAYRGFVVLDMLTSAAALTAVWWWLRALVRPATAAAAALALGLSPIVWSYGAMAASYTVIPLVGALLLGIAVRPPRAWHPYAAAVALALGAGYRQDIGTFGLPVFAMILLRHRRRHALPAAAVFAAAGLAWFLAMLRDVGGWPVYRAIGGSFARHAAYRNSVWYLGAIDAPVRYAVKLAIALALTLGPGLLVVPRGLARLWRRDGGPGLAALLALSVAPPLAMHLLVHFGVPGYAFHYVPALVALIALGIGRADDPAETVEGAGWPPRLDFAPARLVGLGAILAAWFLLYPTDYDRGGLRGDFDLAFARYTRVGLKMEPPLRVPGSWRTVNSMELPGGRRASAPHRSLSEVLSSLWPDGPR